jgi:hypothetical protein
MRRSHVLITLLVVATLAVLLGADRSVQKQKAGKTEQPTPALLPVEVSEVPEQPQSSTPSQAPTQPQAPLYEVKRLSVHTGGDVAAASTSFRTGVFVGETAVGRASSTTFRVNMGYWLSGTVTEACPITVAGDLNESGDVTPSDIITLVNFIFKGGPDPRPCKAAADMGCNGEITAADIIYMVNYVFRAGPQPCDVCALIPSVWSCP